MKTTFFSKNIFFHFPAFFISLFLLAPLLIFLFQINNLSFPEDIEFVSVIGWTFFQSIISTILILFLSLLGARGLISVSSKKYYFFIEAFVIIPSLLPPLILVVSVANLVELFAPFPFGLTALIFFQVLTYVGLCSVVFSRIFRSEVALLSEWAYVHGLSSLKFLKLIGQTVLRKDLKALAVLIFVSTFTSLSLPLLTAGGKSISLEFFIYEKLKNPSLWPVASALILIQTLFVFYIYIKAFSYPFSSSFHFHSGKIYLLSKKSFLLISLLPSVISLSGLFFISNFSKNLHQLLELKMFLWESLFSSLLIGLGVGCFVLFLFVMMSLSFQSRMFRKFVVAYMYPGTTLLGFVFLTIPFYSKEEVLIKWIVGLSLLLFPVVYRLRGELMLEKLKDQVEVAQILGGGWLFIFRKILWPQSRNIFFLCSGIAAFLACGDFAYSLIVSQGHWNLALFTYDLFSSYRLDLAILASWLLLLLSFFVLLFWIGVAFVFDKKPNLQY